MRTHVINKRNWKKKPTIVFLHGYGAASCHYYQLFSLLDNFCAIFVDMIGMGMSSRPNDFNLNSSPAECLTYFTNYLEKWRKEISVKFKQELTKFVLIGHSFGGYIAGNYCIKYP